MKNFSFRHFLFLAGGVIGLGFIAMPAFGQDAGKVQELQHGIQTHQQQLDAQRKVLQTQTAINRWPR